MSLQGESTLTNAEKVTEAKKIIGYLEDHFEEMPPHEQRFVSDIMDRLEKWGDSTAIMEYEHMSTTLTRLNMHPNSFRGALEKFSGQFG